MLRQIFYAVLNDLCCSVAMELGQPKERISVGIVFCRLYHFSRSLLRGKITDVVTYLVEHHKMLGLMDTAVSWTEKCYNQPQRILMQKKMANLAEPVASKMYKQLWWLGCSTSETKIPKICGQFSKNGFTKNAGY